MKILSRLVRRRSSKLGLMSDAAMVGAAAYRVARRPPEGAAARKKPTVVQWMLVAGAALRILGRLRQVRRNRRTTAGS